MLHSFRKKSVLLTVFLALGSIINVEAGKLGEPPSQDLSTSLDTSPSDSVIPPIEEMEMDSGGEDRALKGRRNTQAVDNLFAFPSAEIIDTFMARHHMKKGASMPLQKISKQNTIKVKGTEHSLDNLIPLNVFSSDATYMFNGRKQKSLPAVSNYIKVDGDSTMVVTKGPGGNVQMVDITYADGSHEYLEEISNGILAMILPEARDKVALQQFIFAEPKVLGENRRLNPGRKLMKEYDSSVDERQLQSGCTSLKVIEIAIAYESSFCARKGGETNAANAVQQIVAIASNLYQNNFCCKIQISYMEGFCNPTIDPYKASVILNKSGCSGNGLLTFFSSFWSKNRRSVKRDSAHLFSGTGLECSNNGCVIGCGYIKAICDSVYGYAVNYITFTSDVQMQTILFAHELGHNAGALHDPETNGFEWVMEPFINSGANGFSTQSKKSISNLLAGSSCISTEFPVGPTLSPTPTPTLPPTPIPSLPPTTIPTHPPTLIPTFPSPTTVPSLSLPTAIPTLPSPTDTPTPPPTAIPTPPPTAIPTPPPTAIPTIHSPTVIPTSAITGTCGNGKRGNKICPNTSLCCSKKGFCGTGSKFCRR